LEVAQFVEIEETANSSRSPARQNRIRKRQTPRGRRRPPPENKLAGMMARSGLGIENLVTSPAEKTPSKLLALTKGLTRWRSTFQIGTLIQKEAALGRFADSKVIDAVLAQK